MGDYTVREVLRRRSAETLRKVQQRRDRYRKTPTGSSWKVILVLVAIPLVPVLGYVGWVAKEALDAGLGVSQRQAQVFMRPMALAPGARVSAGSLRGELTRLGYHPVAADSPLQAGDYRVVGEAFELHTRGFRFPDGDEGARVVRITFADGKVATLESDGKALPKMRLDPMLLGSIIPRGAPERVALVADEVPERLRRMLLARLDPQHFKRGALDEALDSGSIARRFAALRLEHTTRPWARDIDEPIVAGALTWQSRPGALVDAFINEVHLATDGAREIHGFGLGANFLFGKPLVALEPHELALLVALAEKRGRLDARIDPEGARRARNAVIEDAVAAQILLEQDGAVTAQRELGVLPVAPADTSFDRELMQLVQSEALRDFTAADEELPLGARIYTSLDPEVQAVARATLLAARAEREAAGAPAGMEAAVVVASHGASELLAAVGGLTPGHKVNLALDSIRPAGVLVLPAAYLTAMSSGYGPLTTVDDSPLRVELPDNTVWSPENPDGRSHGREALVTALAGGHSVAFARLGLELGVQHVVADLRRMGVPRAVAVHPATVAGEVAVSPFEIAQVYSTILRRGNLAPLHAVVSVHDADGSPIARRRSVGGSQAVQVRDAYLLLRALQHAGIDGAYRAVVPPGSNAALMAGGSSGQRDGWAAGGDGEHVIAVWFGRDDGSAIGAQGIGAAVETFGDLLAALGPVPLAPERPDGVGEVWVDMGSYTTVGAGCPGARLLAFPSALAPSPNTDCRGGASAALNRLLGNR
jgi:penicillin-binding protein 1B